MPSGQKAQSSSPAPKAQTQTDGRKPWKGFGPRGESPSGWKGQRACNSFLKGKCTEPSCDVWRPPVSELKLLNRDANMATTARLDTLRLMGSTVKTRGKVLEKDQLPR